MIDSNDTLVALENTIYWNTFIIFC